MLLPIIKFQFIVQGEHSDAAWKTSSFLDLEGTLQTTNLFAHQKPDRVWGKTKGFGL